MWTDYYLKYENIGDFMASLPTEWLVDDMPVNATFLMAMDVLGTLYREDNGQALAGFHVNMRLRDGMPLPDGMAPAVIKTPGMVKQVFA